ncbi:RNA-binding KH domain-containing protein PEPPER [Dendrobium catenatum]|uniref:RNA-binding KH domain-containing protein PEPPER n=1 Tax=Dendrobium catenatum TaxID=906689 RepID=UPI0009F3243F|nr:RNA-binding KH domain-containing protein PEPPER [Dendrobium catenatum]
MAATTTGISGDISASLSDNKSDSPSSQPLESEEEGLEAEEEAPSNVEQINAADFESAASEEVKKWPGWPGESVFRLVVPLMKVGSIIGRKGEHIKKICEETRARVRVLEGIIGTNERIVLISAKEEQDAELSPAMDAVLRVFKRVNDIPDGAEDGADQASAAASIGLLVASSQALNLIGKQGTTIKSIQESTTATIRVLSGDELPHYATAGERIVEITGEYQKVLKALEAVVGHLRKFLVHHSVLPLFEKFLTMPAAQDSEPEAWGEKTQALTHSSHTGIGKRDSLYLDHEYQFDSQFPHSNLSLYGQDPALSGLRSSGMGLGRTAGALVTQVTQTMQIPLSYAEDIIGIGGDNIAYIRRTSGAVLTVQETRGVPDEITVEIKGNASEVQKAQQIIQDFIAAHKGPAPSSYGSADTGLRSSYSHFGGSSYSSSLSAASLSGYGSTGLGGYGSYRYGFSG